MGITESRNNLFRSYGGRGFAAFSDSCESPAGMPYSSEHVTVKQMTDAAGMTIRMISICLEKLDSHTTAFRLCERRVGTGCRFCLAKITP